MRIRITRSKSDVLALMAIGQRDTRTFVVASHDTPAFVKDMAQHGWNALLTEPLPDARSFWIVLVPAKTKTAKTAAPTVVAPPKPKKTNTPAPAGLDVGIPTYRPSGLLADEIRNEIKYRNIDTGDPAFDMSSGLATPAVSPDKPATGHPFHRPKAFGQGSPSFIRFMWDPWTGEMLLTGDEAVDHSGLLANYKHKQKKRGREVTPFDGWIRGYYKPETGQVMLRPWDWKPAGQEGDPLAERIAGSLGERIKSKLLWILSKELNVPFDELKGKSLYYLTEDDLQEQLGKRKSY